VQEEWLESKLLPISTRNAYFEDILTDSLLANVGEPGFDTYADAEVFTDSTLKKWVSIDLAAVASGVMRRLSMKVYLFNKTGKLQKDSSLGKLLKIADRSLTLKVPIISQAYREKMSDLVLTFPNFDETDEVTLKTVSHIIAFACALHATRPENVAINKDATYGEGKLTISSSLSKLIDTMVSSAHHPQGLYLGESHKFSSGFQGNLVAMLAGVRLLNIKGEFIRRRSYPKDSQKSPTSFNTLQETFNTLAGLKTDKSIAYTLNAVKAILSSCVKAHNKGFPGGWINASRSVNGVKSDFAVVNLLGWVEKVPSQHKLVEVLFNTVDPLPSDNDKKQKFKIVNLTQDKRHMSHREFRTAVALSLPRVNLSKKSPDSDLKLDPFSVKDLAICNNFCLDKRETLVNRLNESYGLKVSLKNPKSKTSEIHYKISRDRFINESANIPLRSADGVVFDNFSDLPKALQKFFRDTYRYPVKEKRIEPTEQRPEAQMDIDQGNPDQAPPVPPLSRKRKFTRGQAAEATRQSGRLSARRQK